MSEPPRCTAAALFASAFLLVLFSLVHVLTIAMFLGVGAWGVKLVTGWN